MPGRRAAAGSYGPGAWFAARTADKEPPMQVTDASSILRPIPNRPVQRPTTPGPKPVATSLQSMPLPGAPAKTKTTTPFMETASAVLQKPIGQHSEHTRPDPLKALLADWGKTDSPHDLNGDGTVGIQDMLQLLKQMSDEHYQPPDPEPNPLQPLLDDWGKTDSPHDLNGDGTVGIQDMLQRLAQMTDGRAPDDPPDINPDKAALQALLDDWGKTGSAHDLNGDGTVGIQDMLQLLTEMTETVDDPPDKDDTNNQQTRLARLIADWDKTDSQFDLDGSGKVGIRDMLMLLARMTSPQPQAVRAEPEDRLRPHQARGFAHYQRTSEMHLANSLMDEMSEMEPREIRESIRSSHLPDMQKRFVLDHLAAHRPHGKRISLVG